MKTQTRVVVIGGGIAGCSTLYHLTQEGWTDVMLVERDELTSGTTWHSAAQVTNFGAVQTMVGLKSHSIRLYKELAEDPDYPINYHHASGGIRLASTQDHLDGYHHFVSMAKGMGVDFEVIDAEECKKRHPLIETHELVGGLWDPLDGDIDPAQLCQALARRARNAGAEVVRFNPVEALTQKANGEWIVHTRLGDIHCEIVVNACGYRVNEVGAMMGVHHPVMSMEHMYFLTEPIPEIEAMDHRVPLLRDPLDDFYSRQEKNGLLVGIYEQGCKTWGMDGISPDFTNALCPNDLDRCLDNMERVFMRLPCLTETGIHTVVNGPITYTSDGLPLVGRIPGVRNAFSIIGLRAGLGEGGGHGKILAELIVHGESEWDTWCLDPRRFTRYANVEYTALKAIEDYQNEFRFHMPHEHRPAGRPAKTTPLYAVLDGMNAEFGTVNGWERATYFKPDAEFEEQHSFRFNNTHDLVASEVDAVQNRVGIMEVSGFNRFEICGENVHDWLDGLSCSRVPKKEGKVGLTYFLSEHGNIRAEATLANLDDNTVWYGSAAAAEYHDMDMLRDHLPDDGSITIKSLTNDWTILVLAGPLSRTVLESASPRQDWSSAGFPWLSARRCFIGSAEAVVMSVSFSGELAYEIHVPNAQLYLVWKLLNEAGRPHGITPFGLYATESMRLEKGYRHWKADLITEFNPIESNLKRFVQSGKDFFGKEAMDARVQAGLRKTFVTLVLDCDDAPAHPGDSLILDGRVIGTVTSAGWGHRTGKNIAMAFMDPAHAAPGTECHVQMLGRMTPARVVDDCLYDPQNERVKG
ncbi:GcvT family protein [Coralliovum pocilloporae]|uniref:GcvT family protein n=1 Tax=Coralliovum pocilloporae TaxID=3066369 RepID=UPI003306B416